MFNTAIRQMTQRAQRESAITAMAARASATRVHARHANTVLRAVALATANEYIGRGMAFLKLHKVQPQSLSPAAAFAAFRASLQCQDGAIPSDSGATGAATTSGADDSRAGTRDQESGGHKQGNRSRSTISVAREEAAALHLESFPAARLATALAAAERMQREAHVELNAASYAILLSAALEAGDVDAGRMLLRRARDAGHLLPGTMWKAFQEPFALRLVQSGIVDSESWSAGCPARDSKGRVVLAGVPEHVRQAGVLAMAAEYARLGDQPGEKHGAVLLDGTSRVLATGYNHYVDGRVIHSERDALRRLHESRGVGHAQGIEAARRLLQSDGVNMWIVELDGAVGYQDAAPCGGCSNAIAQVGLKTVYHTDGTGDIAKLAHTYE